MSSSYSSGSTVIELESPDDVRIELIEDGKTSLITDDPQLIVFLAETGRNESRRDDSKSSSMSLSVVWEEHVRAQIDGSAVEFQTVAEAALLGVIDAIHRFVQDHSPETENPTAPESE